MLNQMIRVIKTMTGDCNFENKVKKEIFVGSSRTRKEVVSQENKTNHG